MRPSLVRAQWPSGVLSSSSTTSKRCRILFSHKYWCASTSRSNSTFQSSTHSRNVNANVSHITKQESQFATSHQPHNSSPEGTVALAESIPKSERRGRPRRHHAIATFDRARLNPSCFLDTSGRHYIHVSDSGVPDFPHVMRVSYSTANVHQVNFPPGTQGFLYFHRDMHNALGSQIRFRVTQNRDPAHGFASGHDLLDHNGYIWHIPLAHITNNSALRDMLMRDGLVDNALLAQLDARAESGRRPRRLKRGMSTLNHPFRLELKNSRLCLTVRVAGQDYSYYTVSPLMFYTKYHTYLIYEAGAALCRLERSTLPQHAGRRIVLMRLLKIVQPPKLCPSLPPTCDVSVPAEGELFKFGGRVWYRNVDKAGESAEILRLLYDVPEDRESASN